MTNPTGDALRPNAAGICVIMAGGRGTRFWPLSRTARPKQLLPLATQRSLLRETFERIEPLVGRRRILVITSGSLADPTRAELPELDPLHVVNEPVGRNTAPCAALGLALAARLDPRAPVALLPADHFIPDDDIFREQLESAFTIAAAQQTVLTFGVEPTRPETGYGYLLAGEPGTGAPGLPAARAGVKFVEKPDAATAEQYVRGGRHLWNSGIFVWNAAHFAAMAGQEMPDVARRMQAAAAAFGTESFPPALQTAYADCPSESIDNAVMEKLDGFTIIPARFRWSDLGGWEAWAEMAGDLSAGNRGRGELLQLDSRDNILMAPGKTTALVGVEGLIVVETDDALLICRRDQADRLRELVADLEKNKRTDLL